MKEFLVVVGKIAAGIFAFGVVTTLYAMGVREIGNALDKVDYLLAGGVVVTLFFVWLAAFVCLIGYLVNKYD